MLLLTPLLDYSLTALLLGVIMAVNKNTKKIHTIKQKRNRRRTSLRRLWLQDGREHIICMSSLYIVTEINLGVIH